MIDEHDQKGKRPFVVSFPPQRTAACNVSKITEKTDVYMSRRCVLVRNLLMWYVWHCSAAVRFPHAPPLFALPRLPMPLRLLRDAVGPRRWLVLGLLLGPAAEVAREQRIGL